VKKVIVILSVLWLAACAHNQGRPGVASRSFDCYDYWPYVYSAPMDCFYGPSAFYDPSYYYYEPYPAYGYGPLASTPSTAAPSPRAERPRVPLMPRERRHPLDEPAPDLPLPVEPPRTLP
jgi:hypothetical protein